MPTMAIGAFRGSQDAIVAKVRPTMINARFAQHRSGERWADGLESPLVNSLNYTQMR